MLYKHQQIIADYCLDLSHLSEALQLLLHRFRKLAANRLTSEQQAAMHQADGVLCYRLLSYLQAANISGKLENSILVDCDKYKKYYTLLLTFCPTLEEVPNDTGLEAKCYDSDLWLAMWGGKRLGREQLRYCNITLKSRDKGNGELRLEQYLEFELDHFAKSARPMMLWSEDYKEGSRTYEYSIWPWAYDEDAPKSEAYKTRRDELESRTDICFEVLLGCQPVFGPAEATPDLVELDLLIEQLLIELSEAQPEADNRSPEGTDNEELYMDFYAALSNRLIRTDWKREAAQDYPVTRYLHGKGNLVHAGQTVYFQRNDVVFPHMEYGTEVWQLVHEKKDIQGRIMSYEQIEFVVDFEQQRARPVMTIGYQDGQPSQTVEATGCLLRGEHQDGKFDTDVEIMNATAKGKLNELVNGMYNWALYPAEEKVRYQPQDWVEEECRALYDMMLQAAPGIKEHPVQKASVSIEKATYTLERYKRKGTDMAKLGTAYGLFTIKKQTESAGDMQTMYFLIDHLQELLVPYKRDSPYNLKRYSTEPYMDFQPRPKRKHGLYYTHMEHLTYYMKKHHLENIIKSGETFY
jgi:hypothetical protein